MGTVFKNRGTSCVGVCKTGTTLIRVSTVMGTLQKKQAVEKGVLWAFGKVRSKDVSKRWLEGR